LFADNLKGMAHLLKGAYGLDKALNADAWLSVAKVVEEFKNFNRKCKFGSNWSPHDEASMHEGNIRVLFPVLPYHHSG
jgi:hypothetical protein